MEEWKRKQIERKYEGTIKEFEGIKVETEKCFLMTMIILIEPKEKLGYDPIKRVEEWIPKSLILSKEEHEKDVIEEEEKVKNTMTSLEYNSKLNRFAKEKGIKGIRQRMTTSTLIMKIENAGFEIPKRTYE